MWLEVMLMKQSPGREAFWLSRFPGTTIHQAESDTMYQEEGRIKR
jgi:hypothetical protein